VGIAMAAMIVAAFRASGIGSRLLHALVTGVAVFAGAYLVREVPTFVGGFKEGFKESAIEAGFKRSAIELKPKLPMKLDDVTTWIDVAATGNRLTYYYKIDVDASQVAADSLADILKGFREEVAGKVCKVDSMVRDMNRGGIYRYSYADSKMEPFGAFDVKASDCLSR
jgi:hypothetical protein